MHKQIRQKGRGNMMRAGVIVGGWFAAIAGIQMSNAAGAEALSQPVTVPLWMLLLIILTPTESLSQLAHNAVMRADSRITTEGGE